MTADGGLFGLRPELGVKQRRPLVLAVALGQQHLLHPAIQRLIGGELRPQPFLEAGPRTRRLRIQAACG